MKNKKGISLIVLVITIIVIIILAAAVILTLNKNNPMNNSKIATLSQNKDSIESGINLYLAQQIAESQGAKDNSAIINDTATGIAATNKATIATIDYFKIDNTKFKNATGITLPDSNNGTWCIQPGTAKVYLIYPNIGSVPNWIGKDTTSITNPTLSAFVLLGALSV
ncbi:MAG: hypothetical protein RSE00_01115 [Clostridia bacterium]